MIERIVFGIILGSVSESFEMNGHNFQKMFIYLVAAMFVIESSTFGLTYGLMALTEIAVGFVGSGYFRVIRESRGW